MADLALLTTIEMSTDLLLVSVGAMTKDQVVEPSLLPGWSRAQVLAHIARGPSSGGAQLGAVRQPVGELSTDIARSAAAFAAEIGAQPGAARELRVRLRELEMHHVDLAIGYGFADIPPEVATAVVKEIVATVSGRGGASPVRLAATDSDEQWEIGSGGPLVSGALADLLGWLSGRSPGAGLAVEGADAIPAAAVWI